MSTAWTWSAELPEGRAPVHFLSRLCPPKPQSPNNKMQDVTKGPEFRLQNERDSNATNQHRSGNEQ